jgi:hypothetical protein
MVAVRASETSINYNETTRRCFPEGYHLYSFRREVLTAAIMKMRAFWDIAITLMMDAVRNSETSVYSNEATRPSIPEDSIFRSRAS